MGTPPGRATSPVALSGPLDAGSAAEVRPLLHAATAADPGELVLDLGAVPRLDATGLGPLVGARQRMRQREGGFRVVNASPAVALTIARAGLWALLSGGAPMPEPAAQVAQGTVA